MPTTKIITSPVCNVTCFDQEKVTRIKADLAKEEQLLPQLAELFFIIRSEWSICQSSEEGGGELINLRPTLRKDNRLNGFAMP